MNPLPDIGLASHPFGFWSLVPPLIAFGLAILTRRIVLSLVLSVFAGTFILSCYSEPAEIVQYESVLGMPAGLVTKFMHYWTWIGNVITETWTVHLWPTATNPDKISVFLFTCLMGSIVGMVNRSAGMRGLLNLLSPVTKTPRSGQMVTGISGLLVFFDDYANTLLIGTTYRSMCDRLKISREKLAYIVDSTAAPVSGLAFISTWIAGELDYIDSGLSQIVTTEADPNSFSIFMESIPYRFYVLWALFFVFLIAIMRKDYGPMASAERKARQGNGPTGSDDDFLLPENLDYDHMKIQRSEINPEMTEAITLAKDATQAPSKPKARAFNAIIPILFTSSSILFFMYRSGLESAAGTPELAQKIEDSKSIWEYLRLVIGNSDSYSSLVWGSGVGFGFTYLWLAVQKITPKGALTSAAASGAAHMFSSLVILWLASSLSNMTKGSPSDGYKDLNSQAGIVAAQVTSAEGWDGSKPADRKILLDTLSAHLNGNSPNVSENIIAGQMAGFYSDKETFQNEVISGFKSKIMPKEFYGKYVTVEDKRINKGTDTDPDYHFEKETKFHFSDIRNRLHTGRYLSSFFSDQGEESRALLLSLLPTIIFVLAAFTAFCTGTSWGTMGLITPLSITLYASLAGGISVGVNVNDPIFLCTVGSVLAGAVFGDHCSPISDTTVLSSQASGCNHLAHVWTQMPYAMTVGLITIVCGTLPVGFGIPLYISLPVGTAALIGILYWLGQDVDAETAESTS